MLRPDRTEARQSLASTDQLEVADAIIDTAAALLARHVIGLDLLSDDDLATVVAMLDGARLRIRRVIVG